MKMKINVFLKNLGIADHPGLRVELKRSGYQDYTFGCRVLYGRPTVKDLAHELAHAAQFGPRNFRYRAFEHGFDFRLRKVLLLGQYYSEPRTHQATRRELETFAYQAHLMELAGVVFCRDKLFLHAASLLTRFMADWHCVPGNSAAERRAWCVEQANAFYARRKPETVLRRLKGWLDETEKHLVAQGDSTYGGGIQ
ncbi:hypothetical protein WJ96_05025 [Burkholderia ubonensis]|uniref:SprT-like domain-containing protein n=1 Tax=Burkholderia ubonensis TaxID=101571 RepID=A0AAW3MVT4_9BURK|nr:hypothetical protein [Burkholderia ubonensis]KVP75126.1 hypothetical protein WJ93_06845 [Burkholderia ubonensis]KVP97934.1 hypothetical protein WJ96_05025 [Burkholderia ubonensis]KVZ92631.1 hypothetical protein WL25_16680 [Burkholderia ubonensis]